MNCQTVSINGLKNYLIEDVSADTQRWGIIHNGSPALRGGERQCRLMILNGSPGLRSGER
jgi:hypothetical protein